MSEEQEERQESQSEQKIKDEKLTWKELLIALLGIGILYIGLGLATAWVAGWWPHDRILLYLNGFFTQGLFFVIIWGIARFRKRSWSDFGWKRLRLKVYGGSVVTFYFLTLFINFLYGIYMLQKGFTPPETDVYNQLLGNATVITFILNLILAGILAPVFEETLFRGIIFGSLQSYFGKWTSAVISSLFFSALHFQAFGFFPRFVLGMVLAHLFSKHKSIVPPIAMHALNNIAALTLATWAGGL